MAIGMGTALLGSAIIGGVGSAIGASKQSKAAKSAAQTSAQNSRDNIAYAERKDAQIRSGLQPWSTAGASALGFQQELLGMPSAFALQGAGGGARSAFDAYRGSTGYDFRMNEGMRALQSAFGRNLDSGAAVKAALKYGQGIASDEFGRYYDRVSDVSRMGFGAGSALAGVGQNLVGTVTAQNSSAADAAANSRLYAGNASANMWNGIGSSFGQALGAFSTPGYGSQYYGMNPALRTSAPW